MKIDKTSYLLVCLDDGIGPLMELHVQKAAFCVGAQCQRIELRSVERVTMKYLLKMVK